MKKAGYKLVRDLIPEIVRKDTGKEPTYYALDRSDKGLAIRNKLHEELCELEGALAMYDKAKIKEEIADLQEVLLALQELVGIAPEETERTRVEKLRTRGGFARGYSMRIEK